MRACPNCFKRYLVGPACRICGYDDATGKPGVDPRSIAGWTVVPLELDIWVGRFKSRQACDDYFAEVVSTDDGGLTSRFLEDQQLAFLDHDFFVVEHRSETLVADQVLSRLIIMDDLGRDIAHTVQSKQPSGANTLAIQLDELPESSGLKSLRTAEFELNYLGRFRYSGSPE